jgi:hypothetical protein
MGALSGRTFGAWHGAPLGVWQVAKSSVAAELCVNVFLAKFESSRSSRLPF